MCRLCAVSRETLFKITTDRFPKNLFFLSLPSNFFFSSLPLESEKRAFSPPLYTHRFKGKKCVWRKEKLCWSNFFEKNCTNVREIPQDFWFSLYPTNNKIYMHIISSRTIIAFLYLTIPFQARCVQKIASQKNISLTEKKIIELCTSI